MGAAGLGSIEDTSLSVESAHETFADWWEPFTLGVGPAGAYVSGLDAAGRDRLRDRCQALLPAAPFRVSALAWAARGVAAR